MLDHYTAIALEAMRVKASELDVRGVGIFCYIIPYTNTVVGQMLSPQILICGGPQAFPKEAFDDASDAFGEVLSMQLGTEMVAFGGNTIFSVWEDRDMTCILLFAGGDLEENSMILAKAMECLSAMSAQ